MEAVIPSLEVRELGLGTGKDRTRQLGESKKRKDFKLSYFSYKFLVVKHCITKMNVRLPCTNGTCNFQP